MTVGIFLPEYSPEALNVTRNHRKGDVTHALCCRLPEAKHRRHVQPGVGHYGLFNGRRWAAEIYPIVKNHIRQI
jgi:poly-beta-hydroxyalkanoate depolymerase